LTKLVGQ